MTKLKLSSAVTRKNLLVFGHDMPLRGKVLGAIKVLCDAGVYHDTGIDLVFDLQYEWRAPVLLLGDNDKAMMAVSRAVGPEAIKNDTFFSMLRYLFSDRPKRPPAVVYTSSTHMIAVTRSLMFLTERLGDNLEFPENPEYFWVRASRNTIRRQAHQRQAQDKRT